MPNSLTMYPGDSAEKRISRVHLYQRTRDLLMGWRGGWAVALAGDEAKEISFLRDVLKWDPSKVLFVDRERKGLQIVKRKWPQVCTHHGEINDVLPELKEDGIGFANLDFCGYLTDGVAKSIELTGESLLPRGVVYYTFATTREYYVHHSWQNVQQQVRKLIREYPEVAGQLKNDNQVRFLGYAERVKSLLAVPELHHVLTMWYRRHFRGGYLMGVLGFQRMPTHLPEFSKWYKVSQDLSLSGPTQQQR